MAAAFATPAAGHFRPALRLAAFDFATFLCAAALSHWLVSSRDEGDLLAGATAFYVPVSVVASYFALRRLGSRPKAVGYALGLSMAFPAVLLVTLAGGLPWLYGWLE